MQICGALCPEWRASARVVYQYCSEDWGQRCWHCAAHVLHLHAKILAGGPICCSQGCNTELSDCAQHVPVS
jgi:hypothetical protein